MGLHMQVYNQPHLVCQLLVLQLMAEQQDMLAELQLESFQQVAQALVAHTNAAAAGALPAFVAEAGLCGIELNPCLRPAQPASPPCSHQPSLVQVAAQLGCCFLGPPGSTLPWLQLLSRYHSFAVGIEDDSEEAVPGIHTPPADDSTDSGKQQEPKGILNPAREPEGCLAAMAVALASLGVELPPLLAQIQHGVGAAFSTYMSVPTVAAPVATAGTPILQQLRAQLHHPRTPTAHSGPQQQERQPGREQERSDDAAQAERRREAAAEAASSSLPYADDFDAVLHWLHADRLMNMPAGAWHEHLAQGLFPVSGDSAAAAGSSSSNSELHHLLADAACDWCLQPLPQQQASATEEQGGSISSCAGSSAGSSVGGGSNTADTRDGNSSRIFGCPSCGAAKYCSRACANAAKQVHNANCW